ncbi:GGDEF domain-containing protein [Wenzhouxiangella sp. EGI_FJ10409]|uniref:GGDEF domain-containing protein n=1 Tax=Wenzhouxiangella sp. EGI_FJ10409 TaxID=3243767 RepID=UPI0035E03B9E
MDSENSFFFRLRKRTHLVVGGFALLMLAAFPFLPPQVAALFNVALVVLANLLGFWRWGLLATAWTIIITWLMDSLFWQVGFDPSVYIAGGLFNLGMTLIFGTTLAVKNRQSITDRLTGLFNDGYFRSALSWEVDRANRYGRPLALVMIDLDSFKPLNDRYGHPAGDHVLREFARLIQLTRRDCDLAARYGGDEFALILPETDIGGARCLMQRLRERIEAAPWQFDGHPVEVTASMGAAALRTGQTDGQILREADRALYADKQRRKNTDASRSG